MKRRNFMKGAVGSVVTPELVNSGKMYNVKEMDKFLKHLDVAMDKIQSDPKSGNYITDVIGNRGTYNDSLTFRKNLRSLLLIGNFRDLPIEAQAHPGMQSRLQYSFQEIDSGMNEMIDDLNSLSSTDWKKLKKILNEDKDAGNRVMEAIDLETRRIGVPAKRRVQLRGMARQVIGRLKQSPEAYIKKSLSKHKKLESTALSEKESRKITAINEDVIKRAEEAVRRWNNYDLESRPIGYQLIDDDDKKKPKWSKKEKYERRWRTLGIGFIMSSVGWIALAISTEGAALAIGLVLGVTFGPLLIIIGLIIGIVRSSKRYKESALSEE